MSPCIEDVLAERKNMWGEYHPTRKGKSMVVVRNVGTVFVSSKRGEEGVAECKKFMEDNAHRYAGTHPCNRGKNPETTI